MADSNFRAVENPSSEAEVSHLCFRIRLYKCSMLFYVVLCVSMLPYWFRNENDVFITKTLPNHIRTKKHRKLIKHWNHKLLTPASEPGSLSAWKLNSTIYTLYCFVQIHEISHVWSLCCCARFSMCFVWCLIIVYAFVMVL